MRTIVFLVCAAAAAGCLPDPADGTLKCGPDPNRPCPMGFFCSSDGKCYKGDSTSTSGGAKLLPLGYSCKGNGDCQSGHCVDGNCCDSFCLGQCQACNTGNNGVCTTITGSPRGSRPPCASASFIVCSGACDGHNAMNCTYPGPSTFCFGQTCSGSPPSVTSSSACDGAGDCIPMSTGTMTTIPCVAPPNGTPICNGNQCDFVCNTPYQRVGSTCVIPTPGDMG